MNAARTRATTVRVLAQLRRDRRSLAIMVLLPAVLVTLMRYVFDSKGVFEHVAPSLLALFPFVVMFLITSVATLRERTGGTLERLLSLPLGKLDLLFGHALAFGVFAVVQVVVVGGICLLWLGLSVAGSPALLMVVAVLDALLGMALGLLVSAFARSEFQAVQFMPLFAAPQVLLCGLFVPRDHMARLLDDLAYAMPLTYAVDAVQRVTDSSRVPAALTADIVVVAGSTVLALLLAAATLPRRTP